ncbi:MAG: type 2 isopentenyl-diphosphate Delta-isomerase [Lactovum sp.]
MPQLTAKDIHQHRKDEHLSLAFKYWKEKKMSGNGLKNLRFIPTNLAEISEAEINLSVSLFDKKFEKPFYIEAITGGSKRADKINFQLVEIAKNQKIAMAVGSQSIAIKHPELVESFRQIRKNNPSGFLFANLGAGYGVEEAKKVVDMIEADALEIHINLAQELTMKDSEGDRSFYWLENIHNIASQLDCPVIIKEVGFGMSQLTFQELQKTAVAAINIGAKGGTNFAWIERQRAHQLDLDDFGLTVAESLLEAKMSKNKKPLIATGGISTANEIVKSQILGASLSSSAGAILFNLLENGLEETNKYLEKWEKDLRKIYCLLGVRTREELEKVNLLYDDKLRDFIKQREGLLN